MTDTATPSDEADPGPAIETPTTLPFGKVEATKHELVHLQMPVDIRSLSLAVLAVIATLFALRWASAVFIPLMLGLTCSYALSPIVDRLERWRIPRAVGAALLLSTIVSGLSWTAYSLSDDATALIETLPAATQKVHEAVRASRRHTESAMDKVQRAATELEQAAQEGGLSQARPTRDVTRVRIERPQFDIKDYFWTGTLGVAASAGQAVVVVFIAFFLLASGSSFRRKMVRIAGPTFAQKRITVQALDEITDQIQRYLLVQVLMSVIVGVVIGLAFWAIGLEHAAVWGVVACILNFIPYLGAVVLAGGSGLIAFVQFASFDMALLVVAVGLAIHILAGNLMTPWLTSRTSRMNAVTLFVGVLAFGWLWGVWGLLLGVPILTTVKAVCDRVDGLKAIGELLGA
jgi:predicted PurR-regulated permease PerM